MTSSEHDQSTSDRQLTAEELVRVGSNDFTRRVIDSLFVFVGVLDDQGILLQANQAPVAAAGLSPEAVLGRPFWECYWWTYSPETSARIRLAVQDALAGSVSRFDVAARMAGETLMWIDFQIAPLYDDDGRITHAVPSAIDVTDRRAAEDAVRQRELLERARRQHAEFVTHVTGEIERVSDVTARAQRLVHMLVPTLVSSAVVDISSDRGSFSVAAPEPGATNSASGLVLRVLPLSLGGRARGTLTVGWSPARSEAAELVDDLAARVSLLLSNALLHEEEHEVSLRLQQALLPDALPNLPGVALAARYDAGSAGLEVGGDWYDVIGLSHGRIGLSVGDVVGHGLDAAAAMGRLRNAITVLAPRVAGPAEMLDALHDFSRTSRVTEFATTCYAQLDLQQATLTHSSAGHPPILLISPEGVATFLDGGRSAPLGSLPVGSRTQETVDLAAGSLLFLYSDGLIERRGRRLSDGLDRLRQAAVALRGSPMFQLCDELVSQLITGDPSSDDVVLLCVRLDAVKGEFRRVFDAQARALAPLRVGLRNWTAEEGLSRVETQLLVAVGEACANSVEHAYVERDPGLVDVRVRREPDQLRVTVRDFGTWREPRTDANYRGRGTSILEQIASWCERTSTDDGTEVNLTIPLSEDDVVMSATPFRPVETGREVRAT